MPYAVSPLKLCHFMAHKPTLQYFCALSDHSRIGIIPIRQESIHMYIIKPLLKLLLALVIAAILVTGSLLGFLTITEYKPAAQEAVNVTHSSSSTPITPGTPFSVLTWNIGYGALGSDTDFFMDGGKHVTPSSKQKVTNNLTAISDQLIAMQPTIAFLQEVDQDSKRTYDIDQTAYFQQRLTSYRTAYTPNFKVGYVPYPWPPIGRVDSGLMTLTATSVNSATRIALPNPFTWPKRTANLKRCLLVTRIPVSGSDKELVAINLHLEAYDDGSGKEAQTKKLFEILEQEAQAGNYVIAGGDFNQTFNSIDISGYPVLKDRWQPGTIDVSTLADNYQTLMDNSVPSCRSLDQPLDTAESKDPADFQYYVIDGFLVSNNITVNSFSTQDLQFENSDHNPLLLNVTLQ
jgi:endonuclease/exonuclease/phosphatase family metal-dependent hydrolase